ncbi:MAG: family 78 glycoside hydrolase catalytic domain [Sedimentisphaerales bacterium]|nr:family 78 glycoside hydrolase catalytic domain [Sedimentisphaerales bacterium]
MRKATFSLSLGAAIVLTSTTTGVINPANLRCEYRIDPLGIDALQPRLSWQFSAERRGEYQTACQVQVATTPDSLQQDKPDLWDSGKVMSDQSVHVEYNGKPLVSRQHCYWRVRVWDRDGQPSAWSDTAHWSMGIFRPQDWRHSLWISAHNDWTNPGRRYSGYHSAPSTRPDVEKWVQIDLQQTADIEQVNLHPASLRNPLHWQSFGFPLRFRIEVADDPDFTAPRMVADYTDKDYGPVPYAPQFFPVKGGVKGRYVRITATRLWNRDTEENPFYCFALGAVEVIVNGRNIAVNKPVTAPDDIDHIHWNRRGLTDYRNLLDESIPYNLVPTPQAAVLLRKEVGLDQNIARATATICGLGYYELYLNGEKVGDHVMDPGYTDYRKRVQYVTYDVTKQLCRGKNAIGVILGNGYYSGPLNDALMPWASAPSLRLEIDIEFADGKSTRIISDETWKFSPSEILRNCVHAGEVIDARRRIPDWNRPGFNDASWASVQRTAAPCGKLVSQDQPPIRVVESIRPVAIAEPKPNLYIVDMGVNMTGWAKLKITGRPGQMISLHYNERLNSDGTLSPINSEFTFGPFQRDVFLCSGGEDVFEPRFTYHGFRYIEIKGLDEKPSLDAITGQFVHTDADPVGEFSCSNETINRIHDICLRTVQDNIHSIPTDCPTREKTGWGQDGTVAEEAAIFNMDMATFYAKWFRDFVGTQESSGYVAPIAPDPGGSGSLPGDAPSWASGPWWSGAIIRTPWNLYQYYGDKRIIEEAYEPMKKYLNYLTAHAEKGCINFGLGDWLEEGSPNYAKRTPPPISNTAAYAWYAQILSDAAALLGYSDDAEHFRQLAQSVRDAFNQRFLDPATGLKVEDSQTGPALALYLNVVEPDKRSLLEEQLRKNITDVRHNHISSGIVGTLYVFYQLAEQGDSELAYTMATQEDYPGYGYMISQNATTIWEQWNGDKATIGSASHNHPAFASADAWFFRVLAGIQPDPDAPGFKRFIIKPAVVSDLTWVKASYNSIHGEIESHWIRDGNTLALDVTVPVNTRASVYLPAANVDMVRESNLPLNQTPEITPLPNQPGWIVLSVGSGAYHFTVNDA